MSKISIIRNGKIIEISDALSVVHPNETAARESRTDQRNRFRKETLQKNQVDYYKAYPDQAKDLNPELRRLLS